MVIPNWEHPKKEKYNYRYGRDEMVYQPMRDNAFVEAMDQWIAEYTLWKDGKHPDQLSGAAKEYSEFAEWDGGPPDFEYYRPNWKPEEMTWFQVYETVSEGTPVTPPFETREELVEYLVANGDFWDQKRREKGCTVIDCSPWARKSAEKFVFGDGWAHGVVVVNGQITRGVDAI